MFGGDESHEGARSTGQISNGPRSQLVHDRQPSSVSPSPCFFLGHHRPDDLFSQRSHVATPSQSWLPQRASPCRMRQVDLPLGTGHEIDQRGPIELSPVGARNRVSTAPSCYHFHCLTKVTELCSARSVPQDTGTWAAGAAAAGNPSCRVTSNSGRWTSKSP